MLKLLIWHVAVLLLSPPVAAISPPSTSDTTPYRDWITNMKVAERGSFEKSALINVGPGMVPHITAISTHEII